MNSKSKYTILLISSVLAIYAIIGGMLGRVSAQNGSYQQLSIFMEIITRIQNDYVDDPKLSGALTGAIRGLMESLDPYSGFLSPKEVAFYKEYNPQKTADIGTTLSKRFGYAVIVAPIPGGPADQAGLKSGEMIEGINGISTREMNLTEVNSLLAGPAGKPVEITVVRRRRPDPEKMTVVRQLVKPPAVEAKMLDNNIGYVRVPVLSSGKALEAKMQLEGLMKKNAMRVLLDLRNTAGGEEHEGVELANLFLESGTIATLQGQQFEKKTFTADPKSAICKLPLVVLINQGTAGAAEIVAGAIADNSRGQLVGLKTFGMGSVQKLIPLEEGAGLLISVAKYHTPTGKEIQEAGIAPTVVVAQPDEEDVDLNEDDPTAAPSPAPEPSTEDRQLKKAIEILLDPSKATKKAA